MPDVASDFAKAAPTKRFFVSMLTRDIDLKDAILDLVDNCLDGALRAAGKAAVDYSRHRIDIELDGARFKIADDCGGIPRKVARDYAFKLGREASDDRDGDAETIGMYGIGMKRAIFKMGRNSVVRTFTGEDRFKVPISSDWLLEPDWKPLPILNETAEESGLAAPGTIIEVSDLHDSVARQFAGEAFVNDLMVDVAEHFTTFLQRGLRVNVNAVAIEPVRIEARGGSGEGRSLLGGPPLPRAFEPEQQDPGRGSAQPAIPHRRRHRRGPQSQAHCDRECA